MSSFQIRDDDISVINAESLQNQMKMMGLPENLITNALYKLNNQVFDAGSYFQFRECEEDESIANEKKISGNRYELCLITAMKKESDVFLIDHMWTTTFPQSRRHLFQSKELLTRIKQFLTSFDTDDAETVDDGVQYEHEVNLIWSELWPRLNCYLMPGDDYTRWYLMDEVGVAIQHSNNPNFKCCPIFVDFVDGSPPLTVSLLWPCEDSDAEDMVTRNYLPYVSDELNRALRMISFLPPLTELDNILQLKEDVSGIKLRIEDHDGDKIGCLISDSKQLDWNIVEEKLTQSKESGILKIFCDRADHLCSDMLLPISAGGRFELVSDPKDADVLFLIEHTYGSEDLEYDKKGKVINQFWWDGMVVSKEHLARVIKSAGQLRGANSIVVPPSYDLSIASELAGFILDFLSRAADGTENTWILKRYRGRQSMDYPVTDNLSCALRHMETAPRLACKYISHPCLYTGRKFDIRYYLIVHSISPLIIYRYRQFKLRVANRPYSLSDLEDYQKHFTLMCFLDADDAISEIRGQGDRNDPSMEEFISVFEEENRSSSSSSGGGGAASGVDRAYSWDLDTQPLIDRALRDIFESVALMQPHESPHPSGQALHPNAGWSLTQPNVCPARAVYGVDLMLERDADGGHKPLILEVQWAPDCSWLCRHYTKFWDEILSALYLDDTSNVVRL